MASHKRRVRPGRENPSRGGADTGLLKPDVVAPGDGIVTTRAAGTTGGDVVGDLHVALCGTSMAAPHVAGAAAVLKQARPELDATALKSALMGSAEPTGADVWAEGAGRITVPGAIAQQVTATPSVSFGTFAWPHDGDSATDTLTYTNTGPDDVTLTLASDVTDSAGTDVTAAPAPVNTWAIPAPIRPPPITPTFAGTLLVIAPPSSGAPTRPDGWPAAMRSRATRRSRASLLRSWPRAHRPPTLAARG